MDLKTDELTLTSVTTGIETALTQVIASASATVPSRLFASLPDSTGRYEVNVRFLGYEALPQQPGANLVGAHFEILSTGFAGRGAEDRQRAIVMLNVAGTDPAGLDCEPLVTGAACAQAGALHRLSWQRAPSP